jgi:uncharacterized protein (TIGR03905 family)
MNIQENKTEIIQYATSGTCCKMMQIALCDGVIQDAEFVGGCQGNLLGIKELLKGMAVDEVIKRFRGIGCGENPTSCPDQLAICLTQYKSSKE